MSEHTVTAEPATPVIAPPAAPPAALVEPSAPVGHRGAGVHRDLQDLGHPDRRVRERVGTGQPGRARVLRQVLTRGRTAAR